MANATARRRLFDPADLEARDDAVTFELVDGVLVRRCMGGESSRVGAWILIYLGSWAVARKLGDFFGSDLSLRIWPDRPRTVRRPDVAFVATGRLPSGPAPRSDLLTAPDLIVEVVSPNERAGDIETKVAEYLEAGVRLVWVVYPDTTSVHAHTGAGSGVILGPKATIDGGDVLPGFSAPVEALFPNDD